MEVRRNIYENVKGVSHLRQERTITLNVEQKRFTMPVAVHLFLIRDEKILLLRRYNTGYEDGNYSVIAGHLDGGEEIMQAMIREAREEALIDLQRQDLRIVGVMHRMFQTGEAVNFFLAATHWQGEITNAEPEKCDELTWFPLFELPENLIPYVRQALANYLHAIWFDSYGWSQE